VARNVGCPVVQRINGVEELDEAALAGARIVGVTAGASAPEDVVQAVIARLAPREGVEEVDVTDEEEYFPPPRSLREVMPVLDVVAALATGGSPRAAAALGGSFSADRVVNASETLAALRG
jgi:4-hydroxy-3-methylbut-2-en-1-yl diphosphate reductase